MSIDQRQVSELLGLLRDPDASQVRLTQGVITAYVAGAETCSVALQGGGGGSISGVRWLRDAYLPVEGDVVFLVRNGPDLWVLGRTVGAGLRSFAPMAKFAGPAAVATLNDAQWAHTMATDVAPSIEFSRFGVFLTPKRAGWWRIFVKARFATSATGYRGIYVNVNNGTITTLQTQPGHTGVGNVVNGAEEFAFNGDTDYFWPETRQTSGGNLNAEILACSATWVRPL